ncbi:hypothetical protein B5P43_23760 [Bacillus sp. SRB_336]|nr:hypothetical protein B5P43_23760 [Bacillus sp. SRB_336]
MLKGLFGAGRQGRRDDAELGKGVWRRAHDRFRRGLDRFHQMLEGVQEETRPVAPAGGGGPGVASHNDAADNYAALVPTADALADLLPLVRSIAARAHAVAPSEGMEIPTGTGGYLNDVHRELSRAGNALAAAAEAVAMVRLGAGAVSGVERRAALVHEHVARAAELLESQQS